VRKHNEIEKMGFIYAHIRTEVTSSSSSMNERMNGRDFSSLSLFSPLILRHECCCKLN
jgi:hypothetical protein